MLIFRKLYLWIDIILFSLGNISLLGEKKQNSLFSDEEIIEKIKKWEKELFEEILKRYGDKMFRYAYYQFNFSKENAEEIVQDIFLKVWNNLDKFDTKTNFNAWIYRLAHNLILDTLKKKKPDIIEKDVIDLNLSGENINTDKHKKELLELLTNKLDSKYKEVIILYYFEEKDYNEIAQILGTSKNTVGSWIKRAKDKLKEIIENDDLLKDALILDL